MYLSFETLTAQINEIGILQITLNRPDKLNSLSTQVLDELNQLFIASKTNPQVKAVLLTGAGKAFCAGADIKRLAEINAQTGQEFALQGQKVFRALEQLGKPSLAAINGYAFGGGCELAMAASMRIASADAQFGQPEVKLGVIPGYGGTQRLARLVGKGRAIDLCITARTLTAADALAWGLVTEVTAQENLLTRANEILKNITELAPQAIAYTLDVIDKGFDLSLDEACVLEAAYFGLCCATEDKQEGVNAFLSKRKATFKGL